MRNMAIPKNANGMVLFRNLVIVKATIMLKQGNSVKTSEINVTLFSKFCHYQNEIEK